MLVELKFRNFLSFKDETSFLMTTVKSFKEHNKTNTIKLKRDFDLLKSAAVYGINAGGKSTFMHALTYMCWVVNNSFGDSLKNIDDRTVPEIQFKLNSESESADSMFEVTFIQDNVQYRYGFEINGILIKSEWLYRKVGRETLLFKRAGNKFEINKNTFKEGSKYKKDVNQNVLFLSHLSQNNQKISKSIWAWFQKVNGIDGTDESSYLNVTSHLLKENSNFKKWMSEALKYLEITNIDADEKDGEMYTYHNKYDKNNLLIGSSQFNLNLEESEGTKKLVRVLGPIYDTLRHGSILFVDEFDSKLHPNLSRKLVGLFHEFNLKGAQIIFSAQDTTLLDKDLFRRDQIWFVDKDQFGVSSIYSLSEFNSKAVRNDSAFDKKYLENDFGAARTMDVSEKLKKLLYVA